MEMAGRNRMKRPKEEQGRRGPHMWRPPSGSSLQPNARKASFPPNERRILWGRKDQRNPLSILEAWV